MAQITVAGADVLRCSFHFPERGPWWMEAALDATNAPSGRVEIAVEGGFTLQGAVVSGGVFADVAHVEVIGGAGGLSEIVPRAAYQRGMLRDPLNAALRAGGEQLSDTVSQQILAVNLAFWSQVEQRVGTTIDRIAGAAARSLGKEISWRVLDDGKVWLGEEAWPSAKLHKGDDVLDVLPADRRHVIGGEAPSLLPGVDLEGVGKVVAVDHWVSPDAVRTWAWVL